MIIFREALGGGESGRPSSDDGGGESDESDELSAALMVISGVGSFGLSH